jgi:phosphatidylglycerol:prolipoprotein diacylglycerol transferase
MFEHGLSPIAFSLGPLTVYWYGLVYAAGFLFLYYYLTYHDIFTESERDEYVLWAVLGMLLGSRLFTFLFWYPLTLLSNPLSFFAVWQGGMSFHGGFAGLAAASYWFCRRNNYDFYPVADTISVPAGVFLGLGRVANYVNAELVGTPFDGAWCVVFDDGICRHPYQLYAAAKNAALTPVLAAWSALQSLTEGMVFWGFVVAYNASRAVIDVFRAEPSVLLGLSMGQLLSIVFAAIGSYMLFTISRRT